MHSRRSGAGRANPNSTRLNIDVDIDVKRAAMADAERKGLSMGSYGTVALQFYLRWQSVLGDHIVRAAQRIAERTGLPVESVLRQQLELLATWAEQDEMPAHLRLIDMRAPKRPPPRRKRTR